jgi:type IV secretory pathway TraG/TraD family ATPase VirD4
VQRVGYSPVHQAQTWDGAILATRSIVDVARHRRVGGDDHWTERAIALIAPLLRASFLEKTSLSLLSEQVDRRLADRATAVLRDSHGPSHPSVTMLESVLATEEREQSSIWSTASGLFAGLRTDAARSAAQASPLDLETFFSHASQLHIVAPSRHQAVSVPLIVGLIEHLVHATYERHSTGARLLLALDELANVAPLPKLAGIVSEGGGQGVVTLACLQDLSQARQRWGTAAEGFVSLFPSTIVLPGIADRTTLELIEKLSGTQSHVQRGVTFDGRGRRRGHQLTTSNQPLLHSSAIARGRAGHGLVLSADKSLQWVTLTPSFKTEPFRSMFAA